MSIPNEVSSERPRVPSTLNFHTMNMKSHPFVFTAKIPPSTGRLMNQGNETSSLLDTNPESLGTGNLSSSAKFDRSKFVTLHKVSYIPVLFTVSINIIVFSLTGFIGGGSSL